MQIQIRIVINMREWLIVFFVQWKLFIILVYCCILVDLDVLEVSIEYQYINIEIY